MRFLLYRILWILPLALALAGCAKKTKTAERVFPVRVAVVKPQPISSTLRLSGTVDAKVRAVVVSTAEGNIHSITASEGRWVNEGQVLGYIVTADYQNMVGQAEIEWKRLKSEWERSSGETKDSLAEQLRQAEERLAAARRLYQPVAVASPISGTVIAVRVEKGAAIAAKQPLFDVADLFTLIVRTAVPSEYYGRLRVNQTVCVKLSSAAQPLASCVLARIVPSARTESRTVDAEVWLPKGIRAIPGEAAEVEIEAESKEKALTVPTDAVLVRPDGSKVVFVVKEGKARLTPVMLGIETNELAEVTSGLNPGDSLVIWGQENLKDGAAVKLPEPPGGKSKSAGGK